MSERLTGVDDFESRVLAISKLTKDILVDVSDYELNMIGNTLRLIYMEPPSTKLLVTERISELVKSKSDLQYLVLKIKDIRRSTNIPYINKYNTQFTLLTKQGRPSKAAIESEMYHIHQDLRDQRDKLSDIDNLLEFFEGYFALLDKTVYTLESRKFDL